MSILASFCSDAQNFRCLVNDGPKYFQVQNQFDDCSNGCDLLAYEVLRVEIIGSDTIFWLQSGPSMIPEELDCQGDSVGEGEFYANIHGTGWLGPKLLVTDDGWNVFFNSEEDSLKINTQAGIGDTWEAAHTTEVVYSATVIEIQQETINGMLQPVKTIEFSKDSGSFDPNFPFLENADWKLAEHSGLLKFRSPVSGTPYGGSGQYSSISYETEGWLELSEITQLTVAEVFDFQVGDEIQYFIREQLTWDNDKYEYTTRRVLNRTDFGLDSITYVFEYEIEGRYQDVANQSWDTVYQLFSDTITYYNLNINFPFQLLPRQAVRFGTIPDSVNHTLRFSSQGAYDLAMNIEKLVTECGLKLRSYSLPTSELMYSITDSCAGVSMMVGLFFFSEEQIIPKVGSYFRYRPTGLQSHTGFGEITFINTSLYQCGQLQHVGIPVHEGQLLTVHPNPATDLVNFSIAEKCQFEIIDLHGKIVKNGTANSGLNSINVEDLSKGVHLLKITGQKQVTSARFIKQ